MPTVFCVPQLLITQSSLFCVLTKAAEMISEISGTPVNLVAKHWIQRISFATYKSHCETFSDKIIISVIHNGSVRLEFVSCLIVRKRFSYSWRRAHGVYFAGYVSAANPHIAMAYHLMLVDALLVDKIRVRFSVLTRSFSY
jgi:hypothetical protein